MAGKEQGFPAGLFILRRGGRFASLKDACGK